MDWIKLDFDGIHGPLIALANGDDYDALVRLGSVEEPDIEAPDEPDEPERPEPADFAEAARALGRRRPM